jgi:N-acetylglucosaminyl-diphospho-decaprenol L-rhamnosyltransferase
MPSAQTNPPAGVAAPAVSVVVSIVAYMSAQLTVDCLTSIEAELPSIPGLRVIVVDNASPDGTAEAVTRAIESRGWKGWATLVRADENRGFAAGNNIAIRIMRVEYPDARFVLLLNPDTIVRPGALRLLMDFVAERPHVGMAGGRSEDLDETPQMCSFRFPSATAEVLGLLNIGLLDRLFERHLTRLGLGRLPDDEAGVGGTSRHDGRRLLSLLRGD